jgi:5-formyltetrahydrofolate cyclo-ligase
MARPASPDAPRKRIWSLVYRELLRHAIPDSRFNCDFLHFVPDFRDSGAATSRVAELPAYAAASTILVTADNSLEGLRARALKDGKKILVATYRLRRGFVLLDPARIAESRFELAACLDGMEKTGVGRSVSLAQLRDEGVRVDLCVTGGLVFSSSGVVIWEGTSLFEVQWALLQDLGVLKAETPVVAVAHTCQVVDEAALGMEAFVPSSKGEVQCDFVATPEQLVEIKGAVKHSGGVDFDTMEQDVLDNIQPLQELRGIRMVEQIMSKNGFGKGKEKEKEEETSKTPSKEEQMGIDIVERLMRGLKG